MKKQTEFHNDILFVVPKNKGKFVKMLDKYTEKGMSTRQAFLKVAEEMKAEHLTNIL